MDRLVANGRGAACAEGLLGQSYAVVFLHRHRSPLPLHRILAQLVQSQSSMEQ